MARLPRLAVAGRLHHVIQRGHNGHAVFVNDDDRRHFLDALRQAALAHGVAVHAYVLMEDHYHLLVTPSSAQGLSKALQAVGRSYVAGHNRRHHRRGTLWEGRFRATVIESEPYLLKAMSYIELNPVRAGWVMDPAAWVWSSAAHHLGVRRDPLLTDHPLYWALGNTPFDREVGYRRLLEQGVVEREVHALTEAAVKGWALGSPAFLAQLAQETDRPLLARRRGRPRKPSASGVPAK